MDPTIQEVNNKFMTSPLVERIFTEEEEKNEKKQQIIDQIEEKDLKSKGMMPTEKE